LAQRMVVAVDMPVVHGMQEVTSRPRQVSREPTCLMLPEPLRLPVASREWWWSSAAWVPTELGTVPTSHKVH
jgi:hypothetical protein